MNEPPACSLIGLTGFPEVKTGADLVQLTVDAVGRMRLTIASGDVFVFTQKIVSKAEGSLVELASVTPSDRAIEWGHCWGRDPRAIELALQHAVRIVRMERGVLITETRHGLICANGGIDTSNVEPGWAALLPEDPDASAQQLCAGLRAAWNVPVGVVVSDTFGRPWREGQTNVAIGAAGLPPIVDYRGGTDTHGQPLRSTAIAVADEIAAAAELVMGKTRRIPVALVRGTRLGVDDVDKASARVLLRRAEEDLFR